MADDPKVPNQAAAKPAASPSNADLLKRLEAIEAAQKQVENPPAKDEQDPTYADMRESAKVSLYAEDQHDGESYEDYRKRAYDAAVDAYDGDAEVLDARIRRLHDEVYVSYVTSDGQKHVSEYDEK